MEMGCLKIGKKPADGMIERFVKTRRQLMRAFVDKNDPHVRQAAKPFMVSVDVAVARTI